MSRPSYVTAKCAVRRGSMPTLSNVCGGHLNKARRDCIGRAYGRSSCCLTGWLAIVFPFEDLARVKVANRIGQ